MPCFGVRFRIEIRTGCFGFFEDLTDVGDPRARVAPAIYLDLRAQKGLFVDVAALNETAFNLSGESGGARQLNGILTTYNLFSTLGVKPFLGRAFSPEEDRPGANHVALLSYVLWQNEFGGTPEIVCQSLRLNGEPYTVIGVMPKGFSFPDKEVNPIDIWTPRAFTSQELSGRRGRLLVIKIGSAIRTNGLGRVLPYDYRRASSITVMRTLLSAILAYVSAFVISRHHLALEAVAFRQQLAVYKRKATASQAASIRSAVLGCRSADVGQLV
jgi:hypothetical protein